MAAPPRGDRRAHPGGGREHRLPQPRAPSAFPRGRSPDAPQRQRGARAGGFGCVRPGGRTRRDRRACPAMGRQPAASGRGKSAVLVLARHGPFRADRRPAGGQRRLPVHPCRPGLGGPGEFRRRDRVRRLRQAVAPGLVPRRRRPVGDPGWYGEPGHARRHRRRRVADQLPACRRSGHRGADGAGGQPGGRPAGAAGQASGRVRDLPGDRPRPAARTGQPAAGAPGLRALEPG